MPPPLQSDAFIRRMCPQNHPPPLKKVYNIAPKEMRYRSVLPGIKPSAPIVSSPVIINTMAKSLIKDNTQNARALMMAQAGVLKIYDKPAPNLDKLMNPQGNAPTSAPSVFAPRMAEASIDRSGNVLNLAQ